jgi:hypothetical protein
MVPWFAIIVTSGMGYVALVLAPAPKRELCEWPMEKGPPTLSGLIALAAAGGSALAANFFVALIARRRAWPEDKFKKKARIGSAACFVAVFLLGLLLSH